jgi:hypothetical protein
MEAGRERAFSGIDPRFDVAGKSRVRSLASGMLWNQAATEESVHDPPWQIH